MILDSSVVVAVCLGEPDSPALHDVLETTDDLKISSATYLESAIVVDARRPGALDRFTTNLEVAVVPVDREQAEIARIAYRMFGRGSGHPARLNFGDCFSYALAKVTGETLLVKGSDFFHTDVTSMHP